jgi:hypothetical protein
MGMVPRPAAVVTSSTGVLAATGTAAAAGLSTAAQDLGQATVTVITSQPASSGFAQANTAGTQH